MLEMSRQKPHWLNKKIHLANTRQMQHLLKDFELNSVCREALCPNIGECFSKGTATLLILGKVCTRNCSFCAVKSGLPEKIDISEPRRVAQMVKKLKLRHVVVTSVSRDDLPDGGAGMFAETIKTIRNLSRDIKIEVLVPDFQAKTESIKQVICAKPDIFAHNLETVPEFYATIRHGADYKRSLSVLDKAKKIDKDIHTKSGLMLGLGETETDVLEVLADLRKVNCDFLSLGQYLQPSKKHYPVKKFIHPEEFTYLKEKAKKLGFLHCESAPYVRSSYSAEKYINRG